MATVKQYKVTPENFRHFRNYALITGAAGGMGRLYAENFALLGYKLVLVDIDAAKLEELAKEVEEKVASLQDWRAEDKAGFSCLTVAQDLTKVEAADEIKAKTDAAGVEVEVLVNNAGMFLTTGIVDTPDEKLQRMTMLHCMAPLMLCKKYVPPMRERGNGYVLNVSSLASWMIWPVIGMYSATKRFIKDFSRSMRTELRGTGVSVTNAYFGAVDTPLIPLASNLRRLARNLGVMIDPHDAVYHAMTACFKRRRGTMPGFINHLAKVFCPLFGERFLGWLYRKYGHYFAKY